MTWTQPVCENKFRELYPGREPHKLSAAALEIMEEEGEELDRCCFCQQPTLIYVRLDPGTVPFPRKEPE